MGQNNFSPGASNSNNLSASSSTTISILLRSTSPERMSAKSLNGVDTNKSTPFRES